MKSLEREINNSRERKQVKEKKAVENEGVGPTKTWEKVLSLAACKKRATTTLTRGCYHVGPTSTTTTCNTPISSWKQHHYSHDETTIITIKDKDKHKDKYSIRRPHYYSARKLGAALWEFHHYFSPGLTMFMGHRGGRRGTAGGSPQHHAKSPDNLKKHIASLLARNHQPLVNNKHALQPISPPSYNSSLEMAPHNCAATPDSSIELRRRRINESSYNFKTSTELLKVLNRIWSLEEQHASNISLIKMLKTELDHTRAKIKALLRDQQADRHKINELLNQVSEDNSKSKEHECVDSTIQSLMIELDDERRSRKRSESLHRKLSKELFEVKVALSSTVKDLETKQKTYLLLEQLCDELAHGVKEYAGQVHVSKQENDTVRISELWLDERLKMKDREGSESSSTVEKLRPEIEAFIAMQQMTGEDSTVVDGTRCVGVDKATASNIDEQNEVGLTERIKGQSPTSMEMLDSQNRPPEAESTAAIKNDAQTPTEITMLQKSDVYDSIKETTQQKSKAFYHDEGQGSNSKTVDKRISELLLSESRSSRHKEVSSKRNPSPVKQWITSLTSPDVRTAESSVRDKMVRSKLQEPKSKSQRSRLKILKGL